MTRWRCSSGSITQYRMRPTICAAFRADKAMEIIGIAPGPIGADFSGASLSAANFRGADLFGDQGLLAEQLAGPRRTRRGRGGCKVCRRR